MQDRKRAAALTGYRVLELADAKGHYCGKLLADLGAEVIKVEPPQGDEARQRGPFKDDIPHPERSLYFLYYNTNKKGITLDLESQEGQQAFRSLVRSVDVVVESFTPSRRSALGLDYPTLREMNPGIVVASISGFGESGPHCDYKAPDIVCAAMGGVMYLGGDPSRPPIALPYEQAYQLASVHAAYGILLALFNRLPTGEGQQVEVSIQEAQAYLQHSIAEYSALGNIPERRGNLPTGEGGSPRGVYPANDGWVSLMILGRHLWRSFWEWVGSPQELAGPRWEDRHHRAAMDHVIDPFIRSFTQQRAKQQLFHEGQSRHYLITPVNTPADFVRDPHVRARGYFVELEHPELGRHPYPGAPYKLSATPWQVRRHAPLLGQHNAEVLSEVTPRQPQTAQSTAKARKPLFEGVRVVDFTQARAGPFMTGILAENGAEVIRIESSTHFLPRGYRPGQDPRIALRQRVSFDDSNRCKLGITVNMNRPEGREVIGKLIAISDVVAENFSRRVMGEWGLDYPRLRGIKPDIIMASIQGFGQSGPYKDYVAAAPSVLPLTGMSYLWNYPDAASPVLSGVLHPDYLSGVHGALAVLAALHHRARTGEGQHIDLSMMETNASSLGTVYLDFLLNGRLQGPMGNRSQYCAPHSCYRCRGEDRWCVIAVTNEEEWASFCNALGNPDWTKDARFATMEARIQNVEELDRRVEEWTQNYTPHQVMQILQRAGVPAGAVQNAEDLFYDPHLRARNFMVELEYPDVGKVEYPSAVARLSKTPGRVRLGALMGAQNEYIYGELLGLPQSQRERLVEEGVLV